MDAALLYRGNHEAIIENFDSFRKNLENFVRVMVTSGLDRLEVSAGEDMFLWEADLSKTGGFPPFSVDASKFLLDNRPEPEPPLETV